jgi:hypothetical protein
VSARPLDVNALVEVLEGIEVPLFAPIEIAEIEDAGPLRVVLMRAPIESDVDTITITNDPTYPGEQLWP